MYDPPPLPPGEGGSLKEVSWHNILFVAEQREELLLVSWSSVVLVLAIAEVVVLAAVSL